METAILAIKGHEVLVDKSDLELLANRKWWIGNNGSGRIFVTSTNNVKMHRFLMEAAPGRIVDHINRNTLDNRRSNLRFCTPAQINQNRRYFKGSSLFKGVYREGSKWRAYIGIDSKQIWLGSFANEDDAALAHDKKAIELHGEFASLNFPERTNLYADLEKQ